MQNVRISPIIVLVGPTASGKTAVAVELVRALNQKAEIVSADSVQVYKRLDIGSAKPTGEEKSQAKFHAIDLVEPDQDFTVADYREAAIQAIDDIHKRGNQVILCGGTGLYIKALTQKMGIPHVDPDEDFRKLWMEYLNNNAPGSLHAILERRDPDSASRLHVNDSRRIIRALEVLDKTGKTLSEWHRIDSEHGQALLPNCIFIGLSVERSKIIERIDQRVDIMIQSGFVQEVQELRDKGYKENLKSMQSLGYKELNANLSGTLSTDDAVGQIKLHTRQYARRQMIWFRAEKRISWLSVEQRNSAEIVSEIFKTHNLQSSTD